MFKNTHVSVKSALHRQHFLRRLVCSGVMGLIFVAQTCFGQALISQNDSSKIDSIHVDADTDLTDSTDTVTESGLPQPIPLPIDTEKVFVVPVVSKLALYSSDRVNSVGVSLEYFSYAEHSLLNDYFPADLPSTRIQGTPKSTEYGILFGIDYEGSLRKHGSPLLLRPALEIQFGIHQTYDGSTQALPITNLRGDTTGYQFLPVNVYKNNYFARAGLDIGYCRTHAIVPFYLYSGIRGKLWYRDMVADTTSYSNQITNSELYYWFSMPFGLALTMPLSPKLAVGLDASYSLMLFGQMQAFFSWWDPSSSFKTVSPAVTVGNQPEYSLELSITYKSSEGTVFRFAPYFDLYSFGKSEWETSKNYLNGSYTGSTQDIIFDEPASASWLAGARFQVVFLSPFTRTF